MLNFLKRIWTLVLGTVRDDVFECGVSYAQCELQRNEDKGATLVRLEREADCGNILDKHYSPFDAGILKVVREYSKPEEK